MKQMKNLRTLTLAAAMCLGLSFSALAAETPAETTKTVSVSRQELAPYRDSMKENCDVLKNLMISNRELSTKVKEAQKELKQSGALTDEINAELKEMSQLIQAQRVSLTEKREAVIALKVHWSRSSHFRPTRFHSRKTSPNFWRKSSLCLPQSRSSLRRIPIPLEFLAQFLHRPFLEP